MEEMEGAAPEGTTANNPSEGLPANFKSVDALAQSYNELQKTYTQTAQKASQFEKSQQAMQGFDWNDFSTGYYETGEVNPQTLQQLSKAGYSEEFVGNYLAGQSALLEQKANNLYEIVGGNENYQELLAWAGDNLDDSFIDAYNNALGQGEAAATMALQGLHSQYMNSNNLSQTNDLSNTAPVSNLNASAGFNSNTEMSAAINDSRYANDEGYRELVQRKIANSNF